MMTSANRVHAIRAGNMTDLQKINELFRDEGYLVGEILPFGEDSHLFLLFRPKTEVEDDDAWKGDGDTDE